MNDQKKSTTLLMIPLGDLKQSDLNPRKRFDQSKIDELAASMREKGILQPIIVRSGTKVKDKWEIVFGARRFKAAEAAGIKMMPTIVRDLTDTEVLEIQIIENSQREDIHPFEEAEGYFALSRKPGYDAAKIASHIGRSEKYVYDRLKLLSLIAPARELFLDDKFTAGHAIMLARISPAQQKEIINPDSDALFRDDCGQYDYLLSEKEQENGALKCVSVREFQGWIDKHIRFDRVEVDKMLFPETSKTLNAAGEVREKVVPITEDHFLQPSARAKERTIGPQSWMRADGKMDTKTCEHSVTGVIVAGAGRGDAMKVCVAKEKCPVHWGQWQKDREKRAKQRTSGASEKDKAKQAESEKQAQEAQKQNEERRKRYDKAEPVIFKAIYEATRKMPVDAKSYLASVLIDEVSGPSSKNLGTPGETPADLVRYLATVLIADESQRYHSHNDFPKYAKKHLGIDVWKIINEAYPLAKPAEKKKKTQNEKVVERFKAKQAEGKAKRGNGKTKKTS